MEMMIFLVYRELMLQIWVEICIYGLRGSIGLGAFLDGMWWWSSSAESTEVDGERDHWRFVLSILNCALTFEIFSHFLL